LWLALPVIITASLSVVNHDNINEHAQQQSSSNLKFKQTKSSKNIADRSELQNGPKKATSSTASTAKIRKKKEHVKKS
jgi:hypothetical protein